MGRTVHPVCGCGRMTNWLLALAFLTITVSACAIGMNQRLEHGYAQQLH